MSVASLLTLLICLAQVAPVWAADSTPAAPSAVLVALVAVLAGAGASWALARSRHLIAFYLGERRLEPWLAWGEVALQAGLWSLVIWFAAGQLPDLDPLRRLVAGLYGGAWTLLARTLGAPFITVDRARFSLGTLLLLAVLALTVFWAGRLLSQLLKRFVLARLNLTLGSQEVIATLFRYLVSALGFILLLPIAGIDLGSFAILFGVLGLGLGFAVQGLARNIIGGLVLLVERPLQVGDYVQIGVREGIVERVGLRSVTLRRFDGARLTLPNTAFTDQEVLNWSNPEGKVRLSLEVVARVDSDPEQVTEALLKVAGEELRLLAAPAPEVICRGWRDGGLAFELWGWCTSPKEQLRIKSALYYKIDAELRERGVNLAVAEQLLGLLTDSPTRNGQG
jgi:small-conductance mechanosensitive channel